MPSASSYNAADVAAATVEETRSKSSKDVHANMRRDYQAICAHVGVDPLVVDVSTVAIVANVYHARTMGWKLGLSTAKHIPALMTLYCNELNDRGRRTTGTSGGGRTFVSGNLNDSDDVDKCKLAHRVKIAQEGRVIMPVDFLEYGHMCAYFDHVLSGRERVDPACLCLHAVMMIATFLLFRFHEVSKIR